MVVMVCETLQMRQPFSLRPVSADSHCLFPSSSFPGCDYEHLLSSQVTFPSSHQVKLEPQELSLSCLFRLCHSNYAQLSHLFIR